MKLAWSCSCVLCALVACSPASPSGPQQPYADQSGATGQDAGSLPEDDEGIDGDPSDEPEGTRSGLPCDVAAVLAEACGDCHGDTPQFGAPMALSSWEALNAPLPSDTTRFVFEAVLGRAADDVRPMPPSPRDRLSDEQLAVLTAWVEGGSEASDETCDVDFGGAGDGGDGVDLPDPADCEQSFELRANLDGAGYPVPAEDDHYECFYFRSTLPANALGLSLEPIVDDSRVLHHWLLYSTATDVPDGGHETCNGIHGDAELITGWAPGGNPVVMPADVGLKMPTVGDAQSFILELHYNNVARHADAVDQSGVRVCATTKPKKHTAGVHWLGSENIFLLPGEGTAGSTCTPQLSEPVHIIGVSPHMHTLGRHAKMVITRAGGAEEMLIDEPFEFENQVSYDRQVLINPGDSITSTCTFDNATGGFVRFGESTGDEMCFMFTLAYPYGAFNTGGDLLGVGLPGSNRCMR